MQTELTFFAWMKPKHWKWGPWNINRDPKLAAGRNALQNMFFPIWREYLSHIHIMGSCQKKQPFFLGYLSQMWVGGVADSQTRSKPLKTPPNCPENRLFRPKFHLSFSQISQKPWGGWVGKQIWERSPKKNGYFFYSFPKKQPFPHPFSSFAILDMKRTFLHLVSHIWFPRKM